jgi:hypothetical protein
VYVPLVAALMFVFPIASGFLDTYLANHGIFSLSTFLKWFVFWSIGVRLLLAGLRQIFQPGYTVKLLGIPGGSVTVIRELGMATTAIGLVGSLCLLFPEWMMPAGLTGTVFYALAGINHLLHKPRARNQSIAMVSDLFVAIVVGVLLLPS